MRAGSGHRANAVSCAEALAVKMAGGIPTPLFASAHRDQTFFVFPRFAKMLPEF